jgi:metallophosphoesterase (TIGR00282 family)
VELIIAFIGDVVGRPGRRTVREVIPRLKREWDIDLFIANLENAAGGFGVTEKAVDDLERAGVQFFTRGNHIWDKREGVALLATRSNIVRPANYPAGDHGVGFRVISVGDRAVGIFNIQGRVFMPPIDCPFRTIDRCLQSVGNGCNIKIVDMHAEATSEKKAMGWYLDGRVSAVLGTHTHIRTGDSQILPKGTAYVTDVGMTGSNDSVLGISKEPIIKRFLEMTPKRFEVARGDLRCDFVVCDIDEKTGKTNKFEHLQIKLED